MLSFLIIYVWFVSFNEILCTQLEQINVWGPGLDPENIILPARYIFIQPSDKNASSRLDFRFEINGVLNNKPCRIRSDILDRKDGSFVFRYRLYETCDRLRITLKYKNNHIASSPYVFMNVLPEECVCPEKLEDALNKLQCGNVPSQIHKDLEQFGEVKWSKIREDVIKSFDNPGAMSLCHYVIRKNVIKRKCYGKFVGFKMFSDSILLSLTRKMILPDLELFINLGDWPLTSITKKFPIFSWCGSVNSFDIVMPTYDITESTLENLGRVTLDMLSVQGNVISRWESRQPKAFWRGRDSNKHRLKLIDIARENPDLFNSSITNFFFFRDKESEYGPKQEYTSFFRFFDYKYQISIDGTVASYRLPYLLAGGSLVFKQNSKYYEHFYGNLKENVHYVPIEEDLSDLVEKINWAIDNDEEAHKIASEGQKFAVENLLPVDVFCYYSQLLNEYSKLLTEQVEDIDEMEIVEQSKEVKNCKCKNSNIKDEL